MKVKLNTSEVAFLEELKALLQKYEIEIEGLEYSGYGGGGCNGIEFYGYFDGNSISFKTDSRYVTADILENLKEQQNDQD